jgi:hypothetical protein
MIAVLALSAAVPGFERAHAQDVPGIEICTAEKTMVRRTSCLQSNVDFLKKTMTDAALESRKQLDAANRRIEALTASVAALQKTVAELQAAQAKASTVPAAPARDGKGATKDGAEGAKK